MSCSVSEVVFVYKGAFCCLHCSGFFQSSNIFSILKVLLYISSTSFRSFQSLQHALHKVLHCGGTHCYWRFRCPRQGTTIQASKARKASSTIYHCRQPDQPMWQWRCAILLQHRQHGQIHDLQVYEWWLHLQRYDRLLQCQQ